MSDRLLHTDNDANHYTGPLVVSAAPRINMTRSDMNIVMLLILNALAVHRGQVMPGSLSWRKLVQRSCISAIENTNLQHSAIFVPGI